jgi:prepilin-type N-terminal cleavage/methylation domain-containing protein
MFMLIVHSTHKLTFAKGRQSKMNLSSIKKMQSERGFTIVELLIVIVVIGILAAIVIVAYNGVQNQAKTTKATTMASTSQKKAESFSSEPTVACNTNSTTFPKTAALFEGLASTCLSSLGSDITAQAAAPTAANGQTTVRYVACSPTAANADDATGYYVGFWDYSAGAVKFRIGGSAVGAGGVNGVYTSITTCTNPSTL